MGPEMGPEMGPVMGPVMGPAMGGAAMGPPPPAPRVSGAYDPSDMSQQVMPEEVGAGRARLGGGAAGGESAATGLQLPVTHQVVLKGHGKVVTCLALDRGGGRLATGSSDNDVRLWDFNGMNVEPRSFRTIEEPLGSYQLRALDFAPSGGDQLVVAGSSPQPVILDREGRKLTALMKGDMYLRDMRATRGHVAACTSARWHPFENNLLATASEDGTVRLWDVGVACERGDDASSLNVNSGQRTVMVLRDERGIKASCGAIAWHADGNTIMCGGADGSLQLWEMRAGDYKPVVLKKDATPRVEAISDKVKASNVVRGAHEAGADISSVRWHRDGNRLASRSTDGTLKLWDLRRFDTPLAAWGALPNIYGMAGCDFSPDGELLIAGTSVKKGDGAAQIVVVSTSTLQRVSEIDVDGASVVALSWHPRLNQILVGSADGGVYVMYDPEVSQKGAMLCANKAPPKRATHVYTGGAMQIMTPHALPMFKDEQLDHRKRRREDRRDPLRSQKPELVKTGPGTGGRLSVGYQQALLASLPGGVSGLAGTKDKIEAFKVEDAREEILK